MHAIQEEITKRKNILDKVRNNIKISKEERLWLVTNPVYNLRWGTDAFNIAIEHIEPHKCYTLTIKIESISYDKRIIPIVSVPGAKGKIVAGFQLYDFKENETSRREVKMLGVGINRNAPREYEVKYISDLGLVGVQYQCDYFDPKQNLNKRERSSTGNLSLAMRREIVNECTVRYYCKSPVTETFDALIFTIEWRLQ